MSKNMPIDYRPIFSGQFMKCKQEFGFIYPMDSNIADIFAHFSKKKGIYAHIRRRIGTRQIQYKQAKKCLFTLGLDPHDYLKNKNYLSALVWILEDEIEDIGQYIQSREKYLADPHNLQDFIEAKWYVNEWTQYAKCKPLHKIELDEQLLRAIKKKEESIDSATELKQWLNQKAQSPYFAINEQEKNAVLQKGWNSASKNKNEFFRNFSLTDFSQLCQKKIITTDDISDTLLPDLFKANSLAIDIESNGREIYQLGYATTSEQKLFDCSKNDFLPEIKKTHIAAKEKSHWLVGHNIIAWDLPVLKGKKGPWFSTKIVWDTLLLSWIIAPWKKTHALVNKEQAHRADSDAKASLDLFYQQIDQLPTDYVLELTEKVLEPVEFLFRNPDILFYTGKNRNYPEVPHYLKDNKNKDRLIIIPHWRLAECAWCPNIAFVWTEDNLVEEDSLIDLEALECLVVKDRDIWLKALTVVVRDAEKNNVQVLLRMIPKWLRDKIQRKLQDGRCLIKNQITAPEKINITTYYAYHSKDDEVLNQTLSSESVSCLFWEEGQFDLRVEPVALDNHYVSDIPGLVTPHAGAMFHLNNTNNVCRFLSKKGLITEKELNTRQIWLTYDPANMKLATSSCWHLHKQVCLPLHKDIEDQSNSFIADQEITIFPKWKTTKHGKGRIVHDFVPPTSSNRLQYWQDALLRLLSLKSNESFGGVYILLVSHPHEKDTVNSALSDFNETIPFEGPVLRHLEHLRREKQRFAVDIIDHADQWLQASERLGCEIQLVIESLPVFDWQICQSAVTGNTEAEYTEEFEEDETEGPHDEEDDGNQENETNRGYSPKQRHENKQYEHMQPNKLLQNAVRSCTERFLQPWLSKTLKGYTPARAPIILDCRFDHLNFNKSVNLTRCDYVITPFTETQKDSLVHLLREAMGDIERQDAPTDYETYRNFLKKHWSNKEKIIEDFKPDTQRPAIEAIIPNDSDVLVRLPTGEGKSVLFQVPALVRGMKTQRLTLVITPLRALMADQVNKLREMGFFQSVDYLSGDRDPWINSDVYQGIIDNRIKLLYVAPERFRIRRFQEALARRLANDKSLEYIVVDEAHCISQWGFEFRPDYLYAIGELRRLCRTPDNLSHFLFFSATVTNATLEDIKKEAGISSDEHFKIRPEEILHPIQPFIHLESEDVQGELYGTGITSARLGFIEKKIKATDLNKSAVIIFVTRKRHAEELYELLTQSVKDGNLADYTVIRYFHAGLTATERAGIYEEYRNRKVNVLVCTKAFGMGMDISHIHRSIHLASPSYLEDYLQEVGRTGRGEEDRKKAGLTSVHCDLLYDRSDFDENNSKIMGSRISFDLLVSLWDNLTSVARKDAHSHQNLCVIPSKKYLGLDENILRLSLFWLERCERLDILDSLYGLLQIRLNKEQLQKNAVGDGNENRVAAAILQLYEASVPEDQPAKQKAVIVNGIVDFISNFAGVLFKAQTASSETDLSEENAIAASDGWDDAEIHIENVWQKSNLPRVDDVLTALRELQRRQALSINRKIEFKPRSFFEGRNIIWKWFELVSDKMLVETPNAGRHINRTEMLSWLYENDSENNEYNWSEQKIDSARQRVIQSVISLCSSAGIRIYECYDDDGQLIYTYNLGKNGIRHAKEKVQDISITGRTIADRVEKMPVLTFTDLLSCCGDRVNQKKLTAALSLLTNLGICANQQSLLSRSYILDLRTKEPINPVDLTKRDQEIKNKLEQCNEMARLRSHAMELYARLRPDQRKKYIDDYFLMAAPNTLMGFLANTVDEVGSENLELQDILSSARQDAMKEALDNLHPEKRPLCELPFQEIFLVNAGPGAGKTRVLMMRCAHLIHSQGLSPEDILVLAFNRAVVYEIRERIIELFSKLRYGSYVKKLHVYTFHAFAKRAMPENAVSDEEDLSTLLHSFAEKLRTNDHFRTSVAGRYKAILIDEFQDMNDDFYSVIMSLQQSSGAGLMVIGDDDQDILLWNRLRMKQRGRLHAGDYFESFNCDVANNNIKYLTVNFRSAGEIVERSQNFLNRLLAARSSGRRLKTDVILKAHPENKQNSNIQDRFSLEDFIKIIPDELKENKEIATLCRTNAEVYSTYKIIMGANIINQADVFIQNDVKIRLADIREYAEWLDICRKRTFEYNDVLMTADLYDKLIRDYNHLNLPAKDNNLIRQLWELSLLQFRNPTLQMHIEFTEDLYKSDYERILRRHGQSSTQGRLVISTINKVKGLEFDTVFINPSTASFPFFEANTGIVNNRINDFAAEEARLFYVAMTRAKSNLFFQWGDREKKWASRQSYDGKKGQSYLEGKHKEVFLSWSGYSQRYEKGLQNYIAQKVSVDDCVSIINGEIIHQDNIIGKLAKEIDKKTWGKCTVSAVIRTSIGERLKQKYPSVYEKIHQSLKNKGWLYTVLVRSA